MFLIKQRLGKTLSLRDDNAQISKTYAKLKALNKLTRFSLPKINVICYLSLSLN